VIGWSLWPTKSREYDGDPSLTSNLKSSPSTSVGCHIRTYYLLLGLRSMIFLLLDFRSCTVQVKDENIVCLITSKEKYQSLVQTLEGHIGVLHTTSMTSPR
jgi:hypothetical protein